MATKKLMYKEIDGETNKSFQKLFSSHYPTTELVKWEGCLLPTFFKNMEDKVQQMDVRDDDIWMCGFPKTGTTWVQEMIWCIANNLNFEGAKVYLPVRFPSLEQSAVQDYKEMLALNPRITLHDLASDSVSYIDKLPSPRFIKFHLPFQLLPEKLRNNSTSAKIVYISRNPKDTCISMYHYGKSFHGYSGSFEQWAELFLEGNVFYGDFFDHIKGYWQQRSNREILFLQFEEMKKDLKSTIHKTADFLGKPLNEENVNKLLDHLSFANMKENQAVNYEKNMGSFKKLQLVDQNEDGKFIRCGEIGQWKEMMNSTLCERFDKWESKHLAEIGFTFSA